MTPTKPDDISQEHFDAMVKAMIAYRAAMSISRALPHHLTSRSPELRKAMDDVQIAQRALWNAFFPDEDEEETA